jgi:hypothetical protein
MLAKSRNAGDTGPTPRWYSDGRLARIMRAFADAQQHASDQSAPDVASSGKSSTARLQQNIEAGILADSAEDAIAGTVANMFIDFDDVDPPSYVRRIFDVFRRL